MATFFGCLRCVWEWLSDICGTACTPRSICRTRRSNSRLGGCERQATCPSDTALALRSLSRHDWPPPTRATDRLISKHICSPVMSTSERAREQFGQENCHLGPGVPDPRLLYVAITPQRLPRLGKWRPIRVMRPLVYEREHLFLLSADKAHLGVGAQTQEKLVAVVKDDERLSQCSLLIRSKCTAES